MWVTFKLLSCFLQQRTQQQTWKQATSDKGKSNKREHRLELLPSRQEKLEHRTLIVHPRWCASENTVPTSKPPHQTLSLCLSTYHFPKTEILPSIEDRWEHRWLVGHHRRCASEPAVPFLSLFDFTNRLPLCKCICRISRCASGPKYLSNNCILLTLDQTANNIILVNVS